MSQTSKSIIYVYGDNAMSDGMVRKWVRMFNGGRENVNDEARSGRPSLVNDDLVRKVNERVRDDRRFTISDLSLHLPQISKSLLHDIVSSHLRYRRLHSMRRVYKNLCPATIIASIMAASMWKNSLKDVESDKNKFFCDTLLEFFLQRNSTYFLNKPRIISNRSIHPHIVERSVPPISPTSPRIRFYQNTRNVGCRNLSPDASDENIILRPNNVHLAFRY